MTPAPSPSDPTTTSGIADALQFAARRLRHASVRCMAPLGLTPAQARTLRTVLRAGDDGLRMGELAEQLGVVPRSATDLVDALERAGVVDRRPDPASRRSVVVTVTDLGRDLQNRMNRARQDAAEELLAPLDDDDRARLAELLGRLTDDHDHHADRAHRADHRGSPRPAGQE